MFEIVFPIIVVSLFTLAENAGEPTELAENIYEAFRLEKCWSHNIIRRIAIEPVSNPALTDLIEQTEFYKTFREHNISVHFEKSKSEKKQFMDNKTLIIKFSKENAVSDAIQFMSPKT